MAQFGCEPQCQNTLRRPAVLLSVFIQSLRFFPQNLKDALWCALPVGGYGGLFRNKGNST